MLPLLLFDLLYKVVWLAAVWLPMRLAGPANRGDLAEPDLFVIFMPVVVMLLLVIPWPYVVRRLVRARGDAWTRGRPVPESPDALVGQTIKQSSHRGPAALV
jgi:hypothetical protein